jgi:translation initiation factor 2 beta subunit (eIF-2beta)/eIF-5
MYYYKHIEIENDFHELPESVKRDLLVFLNEQSNTEIINEIGEAVKLRNLDVSIPHKEILNRTIGRDRLQNLLQEYLKGYFVAYNCKKCGYRSIFYNVKKIRISITKQLCIRCATKHFEYSGKKPKGLFKWKKT